MVLPGKYIQVCIRQFTCANSARYLHPPVLELAIKLSSLPVKTSLTCCRLTAHLENSLHIVTGIVHGMRCREVSIPYPEQTAPRRLSTPTDTLNADGSDGSL
jgi:hypothetical protein